jgi:ribosomal protein L37AE/L43A
MSTHNIDLDTLCKDGHEWEYIRLFWTIYRCKKCGLTGDIGRWRFEAETQKARSDVNADVGA